MTDTPAATARDLARGLALAVAASLALVVAPCPAQSPAPAPARPQPKLNPTRGPATVTLGDGLAKADVPEGFAFFGPRDAVSILRSLGNFPSGSELGLFVPAAEDAKFFIVAEYSPVGHVRDDDKLDADALLKTVSEGTEEANEERKKQGIPSIQVTGWAEKPRYDRARRQATWAIAAVSQGQKLINFRTRMLGRQGFLSFNLVTDPATLDRDKVQQALILDKTAFVNGKRYEDYQAGVDKDSGLSLTDLVLGGSAAGVAAKMGLFGKLGKILALVFAKFGKLIILGLIACAVALKALVSRKKDDGDGGPDAPASA
jgi:uncharacterized membrane-anchored protein